MASSNWESIFPVVIHRLMNLDFEESPLDILNNKLKVFENYFVWLKEIPEEIVKNFSCKTGPKLNTLPKTPSVKRRAQARAHLKAINETQNDDTPEVTESKELRLDEGKAVDISDSPTGRPKRGCKSKGAVGIGRKLRPSRKPVTVQEDPPLQKTRANKRKQSVENDTATVAKATILEDAKNSAKLECRVVLEDTKDSKSPSVRAIAHAYEAMLNHKSLSPIKTTKVLTPNSAGRTFASATISSLAKSSPRPITTLGKRLSSAKSSPRSSKSSRKSASRRSKRSSRRSSKPCTEHPVPPTKPTRTKTKLCLNKKCVETLSQPMELDKENIPLTEVAESKKRSSHLNRDSAISSASSLSPHRDNDCPEKNSSEDEKMPDLEKEDPDERDEGLDETHVMITEVFNVEPDGRQELVDYEKVETNTTPVLIPNTGNENNLRDSPDSCVNRTFTTNSPAEAVPARTTRTRARALQGNASNSSSSTDMNVKDSVLTSPSTKSFTELKPSNSTDDVNEKSKEEQPRTTRTRARIQNQQEVDTQEDQTSGTRTRTRSRQIADTSKTVENSVRDVSVVSNAPKAQTLLTEEQGQMRTTRSRMRHGGGEPIPSGYEEVVAGSPAIKSPSDIRASKKRPVEEYGNSPHSKRSRSCAGLAGGNSTFNTQSILLTSSPRTANEDHETEDTVDSSLISPTRQCPKPYMFSSVQRQMSSFMKRTPAFSRTNSSVFSFRGNATPSQSSSGALSSFLKRNTPTSKNSRQILQEQKIQKLQEKERKEKERLKRAAEMKKLKLEEQKKLRDDRLRKVAETREMKLQQDREQKERINRKFEDKATLKDRMLEEKLKAETEKKELREKKQMEANSRRRQEEEERIKKRAELEEEARRQQEWMQRKKECEEEERRRHVEEEKRKQEERLQKIQEEKAKLRQFEEEKRERIRKEREKQLAIEKTEKERFERDKREEREELRRQEELKRADEQRRLMEKRRAEEQEKLRLMEAAHQRATQEAMRLQREREAKKIELQKLIAQSKNGYSLNTSTGGNSSLSYAITPDVKKVYKPSTNPNNYDIDDKVSDDSTDEDDAPKKKIPEWAMGVPLNTALICQYTNPPDVKKIFRPHLVEAPDLTKLFPTSRQRHKFNYRTSSAVWTSPAMKRL